MGAKIFGIDDEDAGIRDKKRQKIVVLKMMQDFEKVAFAGLGCSEFVVAIVREITEEDPL